MHGLMSALRRKRRERCVHTAGETGYTAYTRMIEHESDIRGGKHKNDFVKHLTMHHPNEERNPESFKFECFRTFSRCLERQVAEAMYIQI